MCTHTLPLQAYTEDFSPLCLCDFCPRAFHMACMGEDGVDYAAFLQPQQGLPFQQAAAGQGGQEWACPCCVERFACEKEG